LAPKGKKKLVEKVIGFSDTWSAKTSTSMWTAVAANLIENVLLLSLNLGSFVESESGERRHH
jgi:hypothetical protein